VSEQRSTWTRWNLYAETERTLRGTRFPTPAEREAATEAVVARAAGPGLAIRIAEPELVVEPDALRRQSDGQSVFTPHGAERYTTSRILTAEEQLVPRPPTFALFGDAPGGVPVRGLMGGRLGGSVPVFLQEHRMAERVRVREITNDEGNRLLRTVRRSSGSVVTWRRAQMVLLSAQGMDVAMIAQVTFTSPDRVRDVIHNFNADGFDSLRPKYAGGRPPTFDAQQREQIKQVALARPADHGLPFSTWSLSKLADYLVAQGVVDDISHEGLRVLLHDEGVSFPGRQDLEDQH
jgi:transposase